LLRRHRCGDGEDGQQALHVVETPDFVAENASAKAPRQGRKWTGRRGRTIRNAMTAATAKIAPFLRNPGRKAVGVWLLAVAAIIVGMVTLGGLTRLTGSGLSITQWDPIVGAVPPLSDAAWQEAFAKYRHIPQYILENRGMSLSQFQAIYWWEWTHRFLGRLLGVAFFVPFVWFAWTGAIARKDWPRMLLLFALGGLQGFVGWWMVMSGLETRVSVSQYRLAIHLGVAVILLGAILWTALEYLRGSPPPGLLRNPTSPQGGGERTGASLTSPPPRGEVEAPKVLRVGGLLFIALVYIQMLLGALVAGLHAGLIYNTWPSMDGRVFPEDPFFVSPWWRNFFENPGLAQFDHRIGAYIAFAAALALSFRVRSRKPSAQAVNAAGLVAALTLFQVVLGIVTLISQAPLLLAALHQVTAAALFSAAVWLAYEAKMSAS
jgi:cytochrome c oxidase assembly protein subunit 15